MRLPGREELRQKNLFSVAGAAAGRCAPPPLRPAAAAPCRRCWPPL
jgi:hypothetical protein